MDIPNIIALLSELIILLTALLPIIRDNRRVKNGIKCQLRSEMLRIYYHHFETKTIRQYEYENFVKLYEAYKSLRGNSFIDKISEEIRDWKVIS